MDIFLVPVGPDRHELYCEAPIEPVAGSTRDGPSSWMRRKMDRFRQLLAEAEHERRLRERGEAEASRGVWRWVMRKIAESIAEQRLLWHLRRVESARLFHPLDVSPALGLEVAR